MKIAVVAAKRDVIAYLQKLEQLPEAYKTPPG